MTNPKTIDMMELAKDAQKSQEKEAFVQMEKNSNYRIGVGARATASPNISFFVEVIINLSEVGNEVDLARLENTLALLKNLKRRGYALTYEDSYCISCETNNTNNPEEENLVIKELLKEAHL